MKCFSKMVFSISVALFVVGVSLGLFGRAFCTRSNDHYMDIQPESFVPDTIETVLYDRDLHQIYVCYNDANCVNVYTESGEFLWCVATPYMRNSYFELQGDNLIIYGGDAYIYDAKSGAFLGLENEENLNLNYNWEKEYAEQLIDGEFYFDDFQVYRASAGETREIVIGRPWWHNVFGFGACLGIAFIGAMGIGISIFCEKKREYNSVKKKVVFVMPKAKVTKNYFKITTIVQLTYTLLNITLAFFVDWFIIGIIPLAVHFIFSGIVLWNVKDRLSCNTDEMYVIDFWGTAEIGSFVIAFLSVIIASAIAG